MYKYFTPTGIWNSGVDSPEGIKYIKTGAKVRKKIFVGFDDGPKAVKYYDETTHRVENSRNFHFYKTPPQSEGEMEREQQIDTEVYKNMETNINKGEQSREEPLWWSKRSIQRPDYQLMNDSLMMYDPAPKLVGLALDPEKGQNVMSADEVINTAFNMTNIAFEDPQSLKEAKELEEWPEWELAIWSEVDQLNQRSTWDPYGSS